MNDIVTRITSPDRFTVAYLDMLITEVREFIARCDTETQPTREEFQRLMTLTLGNSDSWKRLLRVAAACETSNATFKRYVIQKSAPHDFVFPHFCAELLLALEEERDALDIVVTTAEESEQARIAAERAEWDAYVEKNLFEVEDTWYNTVTTAEVETNDCVPLSFNVSYRCRGIYPISNYFPYCCELKDAGDHDHGHVILSGPDGIAIMPHCIRTKADILQAVADLEKNDVGRYYFKSAADREQWYKSCRALLEDPALHALPHGDASVAKSESLENMGWWFL